jgi:CheY-like chemotaxis protein
MLPPKVLVVDDSRTLRLKLQRTLTAAGYSVTLASSGREAIDRIDQERPQVVILDIQMPEMDGYEVCEELKRMGPPFERLPIIFLTIVESHALSLLGTTMGAYLQKPVTPATLLSAVARCLARPDRPPAATSANVAG